MRDKGIDSKRRKRGEAGREIFVKIEQGCRRDLQRSY